VIFSLTSLRAPRTLPGTARPRPSLSRGDAHPSGPRTRFGRATPMRPNTCPASGAVSSTFVGATMRDQSQTERLDEVDS